MDELPLGGARNEKKFKVLFFDTGLALQLLGMDLKHLFLNPDITVVNNGAMAELFVGLQLIAEQNPLAEARLYYWHREAKSSNAEVDYVVAYSGQIFPVEVKSGSEGRMLSMKRFMSEKKSDLGFRISQSNYSLFQNIQSIPFYGIEALHANLTPRIERIEAFPHAPVLSSTA